MRRACRCREAKFPAGVMCSGSRRSSAPRRLPAGRAGSAGAAATPPGTCGSGAERGCGTPQPPGTANSHLANSAAESVPPQSVFLAPSVTLSALGTRCAPPLGSPVRPVPRRPRPAPFTGGFQSLLEGICKRGWGGGARTQLTLQTMHKLVSAFPFRSTLKSRFSVSPGGKQAGEERGNCLGIAAAKWVKFRAQSWLFHAPAAQHLPGVWRARCSTSLPCYPKLIDDGFPAGLYLTKRCRELL